MSIIINNGPTDGDAYVAAASNGYHSFIHYEHFSAQVNIHRKCANVTVIYQIKMF